LGALVRTPARVAAWTPPSRGGPAAALCAAFVGALAVAFAATAGGDDPSARAPVGSLAVPLERGAASGDLRLASSPSRPSAPPSDGLALGEAVPVPPLARDPEPPAAPVVRAPAPVGRPDPEPRPREPAPPAPVTSYPPPAPVPEPVTPPTPQYAPAPDPVPAPAPAPAPDPPPVDFDDSG
jgi:outer membrane biosynthesis protein TonB